MALVHNMRNERKKTTFQYNLCSAYSNREPVNYSANRNKFYMCIDKKNINFHLCYVVSVICEILSLVESLSR